MSELQIGGQYTTEVSIVLQTVSASHLNKRYEGLEVVVVILSPATTARSYGS